MAASLAALALCSVSAPAWADPPATANVIQLGLGFRYGFDMEEGDFNPWGPGIGIDAGYTLPAAIYVGGAFDYFFGDSVEVADIETTANVWQLMAELGYDVGFAGNFVLRPKLGAGIASLSLESCGNPLGTGEECVDDSSTDFAIAPGASFLYLGEKISFSFDLRYDILFRDDPNNALLLAAGIGF